MKYLCLIIKIFENAGKNSKDKSYREKGNYVVNKLKGNINSLARKALKTELVSEKDFVIGGNKVLYK